MFDNFSNCEILIFQIVELIFGWDTNYLIIKCRTAGVSEFKNYKF